METVCARHGSLAAASGHSGHETRAEGDKFQAAQIEPEHLTRPQHEGCTTRPAKGAEGQLSLPAIHKLPTGWVWAVP